MAFSCPPAHLEILQRLVRDARDDAITAEFARRGDSRTYAEFKNRFETATDPGTRTYFLEALSYFDIPDLLVDLQAYSISDSVRPREMLSVRSLLPDEPENRDLVLDFALANYETFENRLPGNGLAILPSVARSCSVKSAERTNEFFGNPALQIADRYFESIGNSMPLSNQLQPSVNPCRYQARSG